MDWNSECQKESPSTNYQLEGQFRKGWLQKYSIDSFRIGFIWILTGPLVQLTQIDTNGNKWTQHRFTLITTQLFLWRNKMGSKLLQNCLRIDGNFRKFINGANSNNLMYCVFRNYPINEETVFRLVFRSRSLDFIRKIKSKIGIFGNTEVYFRNYLS